MRLTLSRALAQNDWRTLQSWWIDWPCRRLAFWTQLLFEPGQGWLRWGTDGRVGYEVVGDFRVPEPYQVAPPLRRVAWYLSGWLAVPRLMLFGDQGYRFAWEEARPELWWKFYSDEDRWRSLWGFKKAPRRLRGA